MPVIRITAVPKPKELVEKTIAEITEVVNKNFGTDPNKIWIVYEEVSREDFFIAGKSLKK